MFPAEVFFFSHGRICNPNFSVSHDCLISASTVHESDFLILTWSRIKLQSVFNAPRQEVVRGIKQLDGMVRGESDPEACRGGVT